MGDRRDPALLQRPAIATTARTVPEIASIVGDLLRWAPGGIDLELVYRRDPETRPSSVERLYAELRHRTVHSFEPASDELADVLWDHSGYPAQIELTKNERGTPMLWFQWVHAVTAADVFGDVHYVEFLKSMKEQSELVAKIAMAWTMVAGIAVSLHVRRLGIDSSRLGRMPGSALPVMSHGSRAPAACRSLTRHS